MHFIQILILALVQGAAELLPVSSSAHVIVAEKLMGLDPTAPDMSLLLVMLHTGTMFAVIVYFRDAWRERYFASRRAFREQAAHVVIATVATGAVGLALLAILKHVLAPDSGRFEVEQLFGNAPLIAGALAAAGILILLSSRRSDSAGGEVSRRSALVIGAVQGLCLPFRGFSRSGATISAGLALGVARRRAEEFSFALAVVLTPAVVAKEAQRMYSAAALHGGAISLAQAALPGIAGMVLSFVAGLCALRWLSSWLEAGRWHFFGAYCLIAALVVLRVG